MSGYQINHRNIELVWNDRPSIQSLENPHDFLMSFIDTIGDFLMSSQDFELPEDTIVMFSLNMCDEAEITQLNSDYRNKNVPTDVISLAFYQNLRGESYFFPCLELGDIFICYEVALRQALESGISLEQEMIHLMIHGFLHLMGYDHELSEIEETIMFQLEEKLVKDFYQHQKNIRE